MITIPQLIFTLMLLLNCTSVFNFEMTPSRLVLRLVQAVRGSLKKAVENTGEITHTGEVPCNLAQEINC